MDGAHALKVACVQVDRGIRLDELGQGAGGVVALAKVKQCLRLERLPLVRLAVVLTLCTGEG